MTDDPDPYDHDSRAPWVDQEPEPMGWLEEIDYYEEHYGDE